MSLGALVAAWPAARHHTRLTASDRRFAEQARDLLLPGTRPEVTHAFDTASGSTEPETTSAV
nr:hypothetical protein [Streptomyces sp. 846.5]